MRRIVLRSRSWATTSSWPHRRTTLQLRAGSIDGPWKDMVRWLLSAVVFPHGSTALLTRVAFPLKVRQSRSATRRGTSTYPTTLHTPGRVTPTVFHLLVGSWSFECRMNERSHFLHQRKRAIVKMKSIHLSVKPPTLHFAGQRVPPFHISGNNRLTSH